MNGKRLVTPILTASCVASCVYVVAGGGSPRWLALASFVFVADLLFGVKGAGR